MAYGLTEKQQTGRLTTWMRTCPSVEQLYPCELYVVAIAVEGLQPGLYHYCPREFALRRLREGLQPLAHMKRGRPDLEFLKSVPAVLLVSTIYCRSTWRHRLRGYRHALTEAGHLTQNLSTAGMGLGLQVMVRMHLNDAMSRELIGLTGEVPFGEAEAVQSAVIWADRREDPVEPPASAPGGNGMEPIPRAPLSRHVEPCPAILTTHTDCVAPGVAVREVRPPLTELAPVTVSAIPMPHSGIPEGGAPLRKVLMGQRIDSDFKRQPIPRDDFITLNRLAFRGGSFWPVFPDGSHVGLIRPLWIVSDVSGLHQGTWYYHAVTDEFTDIGDSPFRLEARYLCLEQELAGNASAVCFLCANLAQLMTLVGPDTYRMAHLEAGAVAQRIALAATAMEDLAAVPICAFYDEEVRVFFGFERTGWEPIYVVAVGSPRRAGEENVPWGGQGDAMWRD
jgi:SagB-type dehydrogenase family enzyme